MSIESAKAFIEKIKNDEDFKNKLGQLANGQARLDFAKAAGFDFTADDIEQVKAEQSLTDEELDGSVITKKLIKSWKNCCNTLFGWSYLL